MAVTNSTELATYVIQLANVISLAIYVTGFERTRLPRTQQEDILFTITR